MASQKAVAFQGMVLPPVRNWLIGQLTMHPGQPSHKQASTTGEASYPLTDQIPANQTTSNAVLDE